MIEVLYGRTTFHCPGPTSGIAATLYLAPLKLHWLPKCVVMAPQATGSGMRAWRRDALLCEQMQSCLESDDQPHKTVVSDA